MKITPINIYFFERKCSRESKKRLNPVFWNVLMAFLWSFLQYVWVKNYLGHWYYQYLCTIYPTPGDAVSRPKKISKKMESSEKSVQHVFVSWKTDKNSWFWVKLKFLEILTNFSKKWCFSQKMVFFDFFVFFGAKNFFWCFLVRKNFFFVSNLFWCGTYDVSLGVVNRIHVKTTHTLIYAQI